MKKILLIAPACFPVTGAENIVNIKLLQALSTTDDFVIDVISRQREWENYPSDDLSYFGVKIRHLEVIRVENKKNFHTVFQHLKTFFLSGVLYKGCHWAYPAIKQAMKLIDRNQYDYVLTKNSPSFIVGFYLKKRYGLKWVATWNDPFPYEKYPVPYGKGAFSEINTKSAKMLAMMEQADIHIFPNNRIKDYMLQYLHVDQHCCRIIPHAAINNNKKIEYRISDSLRFIHSGNLGQPRDPYTFLKAYRSFISRHEGVKTSFTIMGRSNEKLDSYIKDLGLEYYVEFVESKKYSESLSILDYYDIAVIIEANCEEGIFLPTKVSDFMQVHIPIFAVSPSVGVLNDLYKKREIPYFASVNSSKEIEDALELVFKDFKAGILHHNQEIKEEYKSENIVRAYLQL